jgi:hypothetical protein
MQLRTASLSQRNKLIMPNSIYQGENRKASGVKGDQQSLPTNMFESF